MLKTIIIGIGGIIFLMLIWYLVQTLWRKTFTDHISDEDVLAERMDCGNCGCISICKEKGTAIKPD